MKAHRIASVVAVAVIIATLPASANAHTRKADRLANGTHYGHVIKLTSNKMAFDKVTASCEGEYTEKNVSAKVRTLKVAPGTIVGLYVNAVADGEQPGPSEMSYNSWRKDVGQAFYTKPGADAYSGPTIVIEVRNNRIVKIDDSVPCVG